MILLGGNLAAVHVHVAAVGVGDLEFHTGQRLLRYSVDLVDDQATGLLVPESEGLSLTLLDDNALGHPVKNIAIQSLGFLHGDRGSGREAGDGNAAILIGGDVAVVGADHRAGAVRHQEFHAGQRSVRSAVNVLLDGQGVGGDVVIAIGNPPLLLLS